NQPPTTEISPLSLHDALPIYDGTIVSNTFGSGMGGSVSVMVDGQLAIDGGGIAANSEAGSSGAAGVVTVKAGTLSIANNGEISRDRKSTRLNSSYDQISYAVF